MSSLRKLTVENFQSHEHSEVIFGPGLNVIVGPSDFGKLALVRALRWLFYNEPRGANFISAWARTCRVTVEMDDGARSPACGVQPARKRTNTSCSVPVKASRSMWTCARFPWRSFGHWMSERCRSMSTTAWS